ncbi:MAG: hypothetical protein IPP10_07670 [Candidatus Competibacteraceae bacterium]|nr:hypothetical protein [Candidatus Competibacteraceae bacterium]MBK7983087.1 hypothetical protein [Candidatus Competibacteraceae bacterium]MBK8898365.1 hypothetical protein [Candidatus Competibacteraceae bacterium]MBK9951385.1 hypothetical protein [Candidatus Competibacteraceae bacterium]
MAEREEDSLEQAHHFKPKKSVAHDREAGGAANSKPDPFGKIPLLKRLLENPELREVLLDWLQQNRRGQAGGGGPSLAPEPTGGVEYGFGQLQRREEWATSSTLEEVTRYCQQLRHRADWMEATLTETLKELERIDQIRQAMLADGANGSVPKA